MNEYIFWAVAIVVFAVLEAITTQLVSVWFIAGSIAALLSKWLGVPFYLQLIVFLGISVITLVLTRPLIKKHLKPKNEPTNADRVIGQTAVVTEKIDNLSATGQVKVDGQIWSARSCDDAVIEEGKQVEIKRIDGVKLIVAEK
ncbi:MAG: NfeD family protein [Ruminococcaceae bacterium]|jgi:membrane protein implicated in regulation of membrane protease activity|nr:NfeD family protein [Oscillospiraceae bacterium]